MPTLDQCSEYLQKDINWINSLQPEERTSDLYVRRNILFYTWLMQYRREQNSLVMLIGEQQLVDLVGASIKPIIYDRLRELKLHKFIEQNELGQWKLVEPMFEAVGKYFADNDYRITESIPGLQITGVEFIEYLCLLKAYRGSLSQLIGEGLGRLMPGLITAVPIHYHRLDFDVSHISGPNRIWEFLIAVFPSGKALTSTDVDHVISRIDLTKKHLGRADLKALIIAPAVDHLEDVQMFGEDPEIRYAWSLSALRFFHLLGDILPSRDVQQAEHLSKVFMGVFEHQKEIAFSARQAINSLKKNLN